MLQVGDYVVRISYKRDILFKIIAIHTDGTVKLKGISYRIIADAPIKDLELAGGMRFTSKETNTMAKIEQSVKNVLAERQQSLSKPSLQKTSKVLHIDGDTFYLNLCMRYYEILGVDAVGEHILEFEQPKKLNEALLKHKPDVLVLTGHDALNKNAIDLSDNRQYKNSGNFIQAVTKARSIIPTSSELIIFAGACQSNFEGLLAAGCDFASSPKRVLIHALDPVFIVEKIVHCPFYKVLSIEEALENTITSFEGLGGYEVLGKSRKGGPVLSKEESIKPRRRMLEEITSANELRNDIGNSMPFIR